MKLKSQKGSITIFVLIALLFYTAFLLLMYAANTNKFKTISEKSEILKGIYERNIDDNSINNLYNKLTYSDEEIISYVGYFADINKDGIVDGVIFADLLAGSKRETQVWGDRIAKGSYELPRDVKTNNVKQYYISQDSYTDSNFGTHPVISPQNSEGKDRFYVIQLNNFSANGNTAFYFYKNAYSKMSSLITVLDFGKGKQNTKNMIDKWKAAGTSDGYPDSFQDELDLWGAIEDEYEEGWFLPSAGELSAFANELGITTENYYTTFGLSSIYWTSSQSNSTNAYFIYLKKRIYG